VNSTPYTQSTTMSNTGVTGIADVFLSLYTRTQDFFVERFLSFAYDIDIQSCIRTFLDEQCHYCAHGTNIPELDGRRDPSPTASVLVTCGIRALYGAF
jgi:hypothetical protein